MGYTLRQIAPLIRDMARNNVTRDRIRYTVNDIQIDAIVLIDRVPFQLLFGIIDYNFAFTLPLAKGYQLEYLPNQVYYKLRQILGIRGDVNGFTSFSFIHHFAQQIPNRHSGIILQPHEIAIHMVNDVTRKDPIDKSKFIYFKGWRHHLTDGRQARNFAKTKELLGDDAYNFCVANNISSCWGDSIADAKRYCTPQEYTKRKC